MVTEPETFPCSPLFLCLQNFAQDDSSSSNSVSCLFAWWILSYLLGLILWVIFIYYGVFPDSEHSHNMFILSASFCPSFTSFSTHLDPLCCSIYADKTICYKLYSHRSHFTYLKFVLYPNLLESMTSVGYFKDQRLYIKPLSKVCVNRSDYY